MFVCSSLYMCHSSDCMWSFISGSGTDVKYSAEEDERKRGDRSVC